MKVRYKYVEGAAEAARSKAPAPQDFAVDIEEIIRSHGIRLRKDARLDNGVAGLSLSERGVQVISICSDDSESRQRFTMAHELGHLVLHDDCTVNVNDGALIYFRNAESAKGTDWREIEANYFAASILMPRELVRSAASEECGNGAVTDRAIERLADRFKVSVQSMAIRLSSLGIAT